MPLQNRVDPFGGIRSAQPRGLFTGNRGVIHDPGTRSLLARRWTTRAWIICDLVHPRGRRREPMGRNAPSGGAGWTELFFLDEVTALGSGHRPCFYCRRQAANDFIGRFGDAFGVAEPKAGELDARLHAERLASGGTPAALEPNALSTLPDGAIVADGETAYALRQGRLLPWSFAGYGQPRDPAGLRQPRLLTPPTTVAVLRAGYRPVWHESGPAPGRQHRR